MHHDIGPFGERVEHEGLLHADQRGRAVQVVHQMVQEMLAHPLFRGEGHPRAPHRVEDLRTAAIVLSFDAMVGQVQYGQAVHHHPAKVRTKEEIVQNWLPRYTGLPLEQFKPYVLLTNVLGGQTPAMNAFLISAGISIVAAAILVRITATLFESERIIFGR